MILIIGAVRLFLIFFSIFSSEEKNSYNKKASPEVVILKEPVCDSVKHIIIGDSQTPFVDNASELVNRISNKSGVQTLWEGGRTLSWLVQALEGYKTDSCVVSVVFCIGTNGAYSNKDNIEKLIKTIDILINSTNRYEELLRASIQALEVNTEILECALEMIKKSKA